MKDFKATITTANGEAQKTVFQVAPTMTGAIKTLERNGLYVVIEIKLM